MGILTGFSVKASMGSEYSATVNFAGTTDASLRWQPITAHLQASEGALEMSGATTADAYGNVRHVFGIVTSVSNDKSLADVQSSCNVHSFSVRLTKFPIIDAYDSPTSIKTILTNFMADNATAPAELYDFSGMSADPTFQGLIHGDNLLEEMTKLAQAAGADLFVNERGVLVCETWKTQASAVDVEIPDSFLVSVSRQQNIDEQASQVLVRGRYIGNEGLQSISNTINEINGDGEGGCFVAGTQVLLPDGTTKHIEDVEVGTVVCSFNFAGMLRESVVSEIYATQSNNIVTVTTDQGSVTTTEQHPFYAGDGKFVNAGKLETENVVYMYSEGEAKAVKVTAVSRSDRKVDVYNITAEEHATYFANGYAVHNKTAPNNTKGSTGKTQITGYKEESVTIFNEVIGMGGNANAAAQLTPAYAEYGSPITRRQTTDGVHRLASSSRSEGNIRYGVVKETATATFALQTATHPRIMRIVGTATAGQGHDGRRVGMRVISGGSLSVSVTGQTITVTANINTTTGDALISAVNGDAAASKLVTLTSDYNTTAAISQTSATRHLSDFAGHKQSSGERSINFEVFADLAGSASIGASPDPQVIAQLKNIDNKLKRLRNLTYTPKHQGHLENRLGGNTSRTDYPRSQPPNAGETISGSSQSVTDFSTDPNDTRVEQRVTHPSLVAEYGVVVEEVDNEYLDTASQCYSVGIRLLLEQILNRNTFQVDMIYSPRVQLNSIVQFTFKDQIQYISGDSYSFEGLSGESVTGRVIDMSINYDTSPSATMSITVQSFTDVSSSRYASGNLLAMPQLQSIDGVSWETKYTKAAKAQFTGSCVIAGSTITATGIGDTGFTAGQWIRLSGASDSRNNTTFQIESVASGALTIRSHDTMYAETATLTIVNSCVPGDEFVKARFVSGIGKFIDDSYVEQTTPTPLGTEYKLRCEYAFVGTGGTLTVSAINSSGTSLNSTSVSSSQSSIELPFTSNTATTTIKFEVSSATDATLITIKHPKLIGITLS